MVEDQRHGDNMQKAEFKPWRECVSSVSDLDIWRKDSTLNPEKEEIIVVYYVCAPFSPPFCKQESFDAMMNFRLSSIPMTLVEIWEEDCFKNSMLNQVQEDTKWKIFTALDQVNNFYREYDIYSHANLEELTINHSSLNDLDKETLDVLERQLKWLKMGNVIQFHAEKEGKLRIDPAILEILAKACVDEKSNSLESNLVKLLGYWQCPEVPVHGFMQNDSLENYRFRKHCGDKRFSIAIEIAQAMACPPLSNKHGIDRDFRLPNFLLDATAKSLLAHNLYNSKPDNAGDASFRAKDDFKKIPEWWSWRSYIQYTDPRKIYESRRNVYHLLLLVASLSATITFHAALKTTGYASEEGYKYNSSQNLTSQIDNQYSFSNRLFITFNSLAFFISIGMLMRLFNELPLRPLLQISVFSMLGAYICTISDPLKPALFSFAQERA